MGGECKLLKNIYDAVEVETRLIHFIFIASRCSVQYEEVGLGGTRQTFHDATLLKSSPQGEPLPWD